MTKHANAARLAGAAFVSIAAGSVCAASADDFSVNTSVAGGALSLQANESGLGVSGDLRQTLGAVTGDDDADWLSRVRGGYDYHSDGDSRFWAETIQPLMRSEESTVFWQARLAQANDDQTLNTGVGYRWLAPGGGLMLGVNAFYDRSFEAGHERASLGAEAIGSYFSFRTNFYEALSDWESLGGGVTEHALGGADASLDSQAPYMPWLRVGVRYYHWDAINADDASGLQGTLSADVTDHIQLVSTYAGDEDPEGEYFVGLRLRLAGAERPTATRQFWSNELIQARDLSSHTLDFVERENRIITESQGGPYASGTITVSRSE